MTTAAPAKFTFDLDLGHREERTRVLTESAIAAMLDKARAEAYAEGVTEGERAATAKAAKALTAAAERLAENALAMATSVNLVHRSLRTDAARLAASVGRKLASHLVATQPMRELQALIDDCLLSLDDVPHLVIRCHPDLSDPIRAVVEERIRTSRFTGRLVVMGDPEIKLGDGRIEWVDGGLVRDSDEIMAAIDANIAAYLAADGIPAAADVAEEIE